MSKVSVSTGRRRAAVLAIVAAATILAALPPLDAMSTPAEPAPAAPLRVCADPDNLPFSSSASGTKGLYVELAERLGAGLGRPVQAVWYRTEYAKRALRNTLLAGQCDMFVGLPAHDFMEKRLVMSKPFATLHYAVVADSRTPVGTSDDLLGRRVAVQLATPPHSWLAARDGVATVTVRSADEGMQALAEGRVDAAYLWGPSAGHLNRTAYGDRFRVQPIDGPQMAWPVAVGFRRDDTALRDQVQRELDRLAPWIAQAQARYGFPQQRTPGTGSAAHAAPVRVVSSTKTAAAVTVRVAQIVPVAATASEVDASSSVRGRDLFNTNCSHCHGPDAASPDARIDLRRLKRRYHEDKDTVFDETVRKGRPDKGMPAWGSVLPDADIVQIKAYIDSVQVK